MASNVPPGEVPRQYSDGACTTSPTSKHLGPKVLFLVLFLAFLAFLAFLPSVGVGAVLFFVAGGRTFSDD